MKQIRLSGVVDDQGMLHAKVPAEVAPGPVEFVALIPDPLDNEFSNAWMQAIAHAWREELSDPRDDIYTLEDGEPVDGSR